MSDRKDFQAKLISHDWYYSYSDDHRYWTNGRNQRRELNNLRDSLSCPFDMGELFMWAKDMVVEQFAEESPGEWFRQPRKFKSVAPCKRDELISLSKWNEIQGWMDS